MINPIKAKTKTGIYPRFFFVYLNYPLPAGLAALLVYVGVAWFILSPQALWSPDEGAKLLQLQNLRLENGRLAYDIEYIGRAIDPDLQFASGGLLQVNQQRLYLERVPLFPLLTLPLFKWFSFQGLYLVPAISGAAIGVLTLSLLPGDRRRLIVWILVAFASPVFIYATLFWEHTLVTGLCLGAAWLSFYAARKDWTASPRRKFATWGTIGLIFALSGYIRSETVFFAAAWLAAYGWLTPQRRSGPIWAGIALGVMLLLYTPLHQAMFGQTEKILHSSFVFGFHPLSYLARAGWRVVPDLLIGAAEDEAIAWGWWGWVWAVAAVAAMGCSFVPRWRLAHPLMLLSLGLTVIAGATFLFTPTPYRAAHGLLFTTPWALLGICRAGEVWRQGDWRLRVMVSATMLGLVSYLLALIVIRAPNWGPHGALEWGARYMLTFYPFLAVMAVWGLKAKWRTVSSGVIIGALVFLGLGFQIRGLWTIYSDKQINAALNQSIAAASSPYIVSDLWWLPLNAAPLYKQKTVFFVTPDNLTAWVDVAAAHQGQEFLLVTLNSSLLKKANQSLELYQLTPLDHYTLGNLLIYNLAIQNKP